MFYQTAQLEKAVWSFFWLQLPVPVLLRGGEESELKELIWAWWKGRGVWRYFSSRLCFSPSKSLFNWKNLNYFSQVKSVLSVMAMGEWSPCLYLNPWAFPSCFLPLSCWEGGGRECLGEEESVWGRVPRLTHQAELVTSGHLIWLTVWQG